MVFFYSKRTPSGHSPSFMNMLVLERMQISFNILRLTPEISVPSEGMGGKPRAMEAEASC